MLQAHSVCPIINNDYLVFSFKETLLGNKSIADDGDPLDEDFVSDDDGFSMEIMRSISLLFIYRR